MQREQLNRLAEIILKIPFGFGVFSDVYKRQDLYKSGKVRAIGVSNFRRNHLTPLLDAEVIPMVNQLELHPGMVQADIVSLCREHQILLEAYSPLGNGKLLNSKELSEMAEHYGKTPAQICICLLYTSRCV